MEKEVREKQGEFIFQKRDVKAGGKSGKKAM
jgi:hypothetical protein